MEGWGVDTPKFKKKPRKFGQKLMVAALSFGQNLVFLSRSKLVFVTGLYLIYVSGKSK